MIDGYISPEYVTFDLLGQILTAMTHAFGIDLQSDTQDLFIKLVTVVEFLVVFLDYSDLLIHL